ncbi:MAG TPA: cytidine deaminase [Deltaproteobacteria bacterium]|nr:cytidine deaminase [Deltaproteobacteria bacterium]HCP46039.1 cytidine deaminase [Deltaproteobacteria bacterium]
MNDLLDAAIEARGRSHAPYSKFLVGAAVRGATGRIYTGSNVESSSYGLTICAERLAICTALHQGETELVEIAVVADTQGAPGPCGACRQFMYDFAPKATVLMADLHGDTRTVSVEDLIPFAFGPGDLASFEGHNHSGTSDDE